MFTKLWTWLKSLFSKGKAEMDNVSNSSIPAAEVVPAPVVSVVADPAPDAPASASVAPTTITLAVDTSAVQSALDEAKAEVASAVAQIEAEVDAKLFEVKKLLDFYGHDIPIWDEIVALAKKV
ncbi:hypothetical protein BFS86_19505 [Shewanella algae]|nr:hypothetical protein BFS86_19505 [Shewanella algae]DAU40290.1 MAG TPA: hypothetical protein [Caudoviricetes sp.]